MRLEKYKSKLQCENVSRDSVKKVVEEIRKSSGKYDKTIDEINFWTANDKDGSIFINYKDGYATILDHFCKECDIDDVVDSLVDQINGTIGEF
jgi:hypothetical protein